jgi:hypothetical protein
MLATTVSDMSGNALNAISAAAALNLTASSVNPVKT